MSRIPRIAAVTMIVVGPILMVLGVATYFLVQRELSDEHIVVSDDAETNAGEDVEGPFTAYSEAMVIKEHAIEIGGGKTYAELPQDDPKRDTVATSSFLRASLFTSVVAFGVSTGRRAGAVILLNGLALSGIMKRIDRMDGWGDRYPATTT